MHFLSCGGELNHHGKFMCESMHELLGDDYKRITTAFVNNTRKTLGYSDEIAKEFNINGSNFSLQEINDWIEWADVVEYGSAPEVYLHQAIRNNKVVFIRMERLLKEGVWKLLVPSVFLKYYRKYIQYKNCNNVYYLCVGAYVAEDLKRIGIKGPNILQWAYCPEFIDYKEFEFKKNKKEDIEIFWCGRLISWKHPEIAISVAEQLRKKGIRFNMEIAGTGPLEKKVINMINSKMLQDQVSFIGTVPANSMRKKMLEKDVFLATSDQNEGWGVVINEAMNSGCAVIATNEMGAVPVLIDNGFNGFTFTRNSVERAVEIIVSLYNNKNLLSNIQQNAFNTIKNNYTPSIYANTLLQISIEALNGKIIQRKGLGGQVYL